MMKNFKQLKYFLLAILLVATACEKEDNEEIPGQPPTVSAGPDLNGTVGSTVALNGSASDPDGDQLTINWEIVTAPTGSSANISNASSATASFVPDAVGSYTLKLTADDGNYDPVLDEVIVTVAEALGEPPVATIVNENGQIISAENENNTVPVGTNYILDATGSNDPDGDEITFAWEVTVAPENAEYTLTESTAKSEATFAPKTVGEYKIKVTVTDPDENTATAEVTLAATAESVLVTENVDADTTWIDLFADPAMPDYIVKNDIDVNAALTLQPGVVIHLDEDIIITVETGGTMVAEGTQEKPITFTSSDEVGQIYWGGLLFKSSSANNSLSHVVVKFGGGDDYLIYTNEYLKANVGVEKDGRVKIANSQITNSEGDGMVVVGSNNLSLFENNTFANNNNYAMSISVNQAGAIATSNVFQDNGDTQKRENIIRIYDSSMDMDQEWFALGGNASYVFVGDADINAKLTIHEGVKMEFAEGVTLSVESSGVITAKGTTDKKIVFTGNSIGEGQNWGGLVIKSTSVNNELDHVQILYAGEDQYLVYDSEYRSANLAIDNGAKLKFTNSEIANGAAHGMYVHTNAILTAFGNNNFHDNVNYPLFMPANQVGMVDKATTFINNGDNVVAITGSTFDSNASFRDVSNSQWVALNGEARYLITGDLNIDDDLVIAPGAYFMINEDVVLTVNSSGSLKAVGYADSLIVFTAYNEDGNNNWGGLSIKSDNGNDIQYAKIAYAGTEQYLIYSGTYFQANIGVDNNSSLQVLNTEVSNSKGYGLVVHANATVNGLSGADTDPANTLITDGENTFSSNASGDAIFDN